MKFIYRILAFVFSGVLMLIVMTVTYVAYLKFSNDSVCHFCQSGLTAIFSVLINPVQLYSQQTGLIEDVCGNYKSLDGCKIGVKTWWESMAKTIFSPQLVLKVCQGGLDSKCMISRESCDKQICQNEVSKLFNYMMSKPILSDIVDMLKNSQFCQDAEKIHLNSGQILSCQEFVPTFIPMALEVLFTLEKSEIANICNLVFGVC